MDWREAETILKAGTGASQVLPSPTAGLRVRLAPSSATSKLPQAPFMEGSAGPWSRGRLEQDPICAVGGTQQGRSCGPCSCSPCPSHTAQNSGFAVLGFDFLVPRWSFWGWTEVRAPAGPWIGWSTLDRLCLIFLLSKGDCSRLPKSTGGLY